MRKKRKISGIINRCRSCYKAVAPHDFINNDQAAIAMVLVFLIQILPIIFFFVAFMFIIANIMQIALAIILIGIGVILIRFALKGSGKFLKKLKGDKAGGTTPFYGDY